MKYKVTLNGRTYEVEVEAGKAMLLPPLPLLHLLRLSSPVPATP